MKSKIYFVKFRSIFANIYANENNIHKLKLYLPTVIFYNEIVMLKYNEKL